MTSEVPVMEECEARKLPVKSISKQSAKAIKALQDHFAKSKSEGNTPDQFIYLVIGLRRIAARASVKPHRLAIPHPWRCPTDSSNLSVCLITKDPLESERPKIPAMPAISAIESVRSLSTKHKSYEAKRFLCAAHDLFLADERVLPVLPKLLGKVFFDKKKQPAPVNLACSDVNAELEAAIKATYLHLNTGPCTVIRVGRIDQLVVEVQDNVEAVLEQLKTRLPEGGHSNIRSLMMKTTNSISLPLYEYDS